MEDLSRNMEKVVKAHTPPKPSKSAGSWSVLLLEDHGRMVLLGKLKRLVIPDYCYSFFCLAINCFQKHKRR
jgi:hypothetical protein